jgi:hypothetical protein
MIKLLLPIIFIFMLGNHSDGIDSSEPLIQNSVILPIKKINSRFIQDLPQGTVYSLPRGCSHNDYWQKPPLFKALSMGYTYIEADILLIKNRLVVAHRRPLRPSKTKDLTEMYLDPLFKIYNEKGYFYKDHPSPIFLMIDIKTGAEETYEKLLEVIKPYESMLTQFVDGVEIPGGITLIITGNRPVETIAAERDRWVAIDGRPLDLGKGYPLNLMPMVSEKYSTILGWTTTFGPKSPKNILKVQDFVSKVQAEGRLTRLWKIPEKRESWNWLTYHGIDLLNTDNLADLHDYLRSAESSPNFAKKTK